jgi:integrase/recombinase XerD
MTVIAVRLSRSGNAAGELVVRLGVPLLDEYLEFVAGRCRPNTVLAVAYDLKVFSSRWSASRRGGCGRSMCWRS